MAGRVGVLLQVTPTGAGPLPQVLPGPLVVLVESVTVGGRRGVVGGGRPVVTASDVFLGGSVLGPKGR